MALEDFLQRLAQELAPRIKAEIERSSVWVSQKGSPLGRNRHCAAVRRRIAQGLEGASIIGRQFLLAPEALQEEMRAHNGLVFRPLAKVAANDKSLPPIIQRVNARIARGG